mgnify:CR=1 FL=1
MALQSPFFNNKRDADTACALLAEHTQGTQSFGRNRGPGGNVNDAAGGPNVTSKGTVPLPAIGTTASDTSRTFTFPSPSRSWSGT